MLTVIHGGEVYAPEPRGRADVLLAGGRVGWIAGEIPVPEGVGEVTRIDATGMLVVPGFIDAHVHIIGGGGEGGFHTRTPEIMLTDLTRAGITTVGGLLGTDGTCRDLSSLLAKARGLEQEGISSFIYTGSYEVPLVTLTGGITSDIVLIDKIVGAGEVAISDHRSCQPTFEELARVAAAARLGGILAGKAGIVQIHVGDGPGHIDLLDDIATRTEVPRRQFLPTHMNRNRDLFEAGLSFARRGGLVDLTTSTTPEFLEQGEVRACAGLRDLREHGVPIEQVTLSSDGQGSLPAFDEEGQYLGLQVGSVSSLFGEVRAAVLQEGVPVEEALRTITANPARIHKLEGKGALEVGADADVVLLRAEDLQIDTVLARGRVLVAGGEPQVYGTFERAPAPAGVPSPGPTA